MLVIRTVFMTILISWAYAYGGNADQHRYMVISEDLKIDYVNHSVFDISGAVYKLNSQTTALNVTFTLKIALPENTKFAIKAFKLVNTQYRDSIVQFQKRLRDVFEMETFDLQSLWVEHARPSITWPLEVGVAYRTVGWNPDTTKFPPNLPEGRYKVQVTLGIPHQNNFGVLYWFAKADYSKH